MAYLLIIDDDEDFAAATATVLKNAGHEVSVELNPESGLKSMEKRCPDLVILDVMFPEDASGGFKLARSIRSEKEKFDDIPLLMLTAINTKFPMGFGPNDIDEDWMPITDFLEKPVDLDVLENKVASLLAK
jgi:DNA-binding response OmpR family regulator